MVNYIRLFPDDILRPGKDGPMSQDSLFLPHGGYLQLRSYKVAVAVYEATVAFCDRFIDRRSRTHDQMVQAARSGVRNISEGSGAGATSRKTEIHLTNVALASLADELLRDYESFLLQRGLPRWEKDSPETTAARNRLMLDEPARDPLTGPIALSCLSALPTYMAKATPEQAANVMLCAIHQATYLLRRQLQGQSRQFLQEGGFSERLHTKRLERRASDPVGPGRTTSDPSNRSAPACPVCGNPMQQKTARQGPFKGKPFLGCTGYPACHGVRR
jgi:four helix bundle suffix protein